MKEEEAKKVMDTIRELSVDSQNARRETAQEIMDFIQRNLMARPDKPLATMKFSAWVKLSKILRNYGAKV
jgi:hypothetical protein